MTAPLPHDPYRLFHTLEAALPPIYGENIRHVLNREPCVEFENGVTDRMVVVLYAARSGSTYASQLLSAHPELSKVSAWTQPEKLERLRRDHSTEYDDRALSRLIMTQARPAFGFKANVMGLLSSAYLGLLDRYFDRTNFAIVRRRDVVAQAVSLHKGKLSGQFNSNQSSRRQVTIDDFDFDAIRRHIVNIGNVYRAHETCLAALGVDAATYYYEDIAADPGEFVADLGRRTGLDPAELKHSTHVEKIADGVNRAWGDMYREREAEG